MVETECHLTAIGGSKRNSDKLSDEYAPEEKRWHPKFFPLSTIYVDNKSCVLCQASLGWGCIDLSKVSSAAGLGGISRGDYVIQNTMPKWILEIFQPSFYYILMGGVFCSWKKKKKVHLKYLKDCLAALMHTLYKLFSWWLSLIPDLFPTSVVRFCVTQPLKLYHKTSYYCHQLAEMEWNTENEPIFSEV